MKSTIAFTLLLVLLCSSASLMAGQSVSVAGEWETTFTSPQGPIKAKTIFKQDGESLSGVIRNERGEVTLQGAIKGKEIRVSLTVRHQGNDLQVTVTGEIDGDSMKGKADFGGLFEGDWMAKRITQSANISNNTPPSEKIDVSGVWVFSTDSGSPVFSFKQEGEILTGQYKGALGEAPLTGTVKGSEIKFSLRFSAQGKEGSVTYAGTIEKSSMKGVARFGDLGSVSWTAKRQQ